MSTDDSGGHASPATRPVGSTVVTRRPCALQWLAAGWRDLVAQPGVSLLYGLGVFLVSAVVVGGLVVLGLDYILFPAFAGFMVVGPLLAVGLYEKSRRHRGRYAREPCAA